MCNVLFLVEILWSGSGFYVLKWFVGIFISFNFYLWKEENEIVYCVGFLWVKEFNLYVDSGLFCYKESLR